MIKEKISFLILLVLIVTSNSCKKYDEGPGLSFRSKKERVANDWIIEKAIDKGYDVTKYYSNYKYKYKVNGTYEIYKNDNLFLYGIWFLDKNKNNIIFKLNNDSIEQKRKILKLKENNFWYLIESEKFEFHFKKK